MKRINLFSKHRKPTNLHTHKHTHKGRREKEISHIWLAATTCSGVARKLVFNKKYGTQKFVQCLLAEFLGTYIFLGKIELSSHIQSLSEFWRDNPIQRAEEILLVMYSYCKQIHTMVSVCTALPLAAAQLHERIF